MAEKKISVSDVNGGNVEIIAGNKVRNAQGSSFSKAQSSETINIEVNKLISAAVSIVAGDDISFGNPTFYEGISSLENIVIEKIEADKQIEAMKIIAAIKAESQKSSPNRRNIRDYLDALLKLFTLLNLDPQIFTNIKIFIESILKKM